MLLIILNNSDQCKTFATVELKFFGFFYSIRIYLRVSSIYFAVSSAELPDFEKSITGVA